MSITTVIFIVTHHRQKHLDLAYTTFDLPILIETETATQIHVQYFNTNNMRFHENPPSWSRVET
jgi:hypothetical protein